METLVWVVFIVLGCLLLLQYSYFKKQLQKQGFQQARPIGGKESSKAQNSDFYAGIIDVTNLRSLTTGWEIKITNFDEYTNLIKQKGTIMSVVGNYSKGKTFLYELLTNSKTPHGFNVNTQGISIVYLKDKKGKQKPIIGLDTKGRGNALDISSLRGNMPLEGNSDLIKEQEESHVGELIRDHGATEDLLQNFIMDKSSIIIIMVSDLTFEDQKLIKKIQNKFKNDGSKRIIVVHNLFHTLQKDEVDIKIKNNILKSFNLTEMDYREDQPNRNRKYFVDAKKTPHLILAKQFSEAGDYYNYTTIQYIQHCLNTCPNDKCFDIIKEFHEYLKNYVPLYIKSTSDLKPDNIEMVVDENKKPTKIRIKDVDKIEWGMERC